MSKIKSPKEFIIQSYEMEGILKVLKSYAEHVRDVTLEEAAQKAKCKVSKNPPYEKLGVSKETILGLKFSDNLKIE